MRNRMDEATKKYGLNFSLIATPAEGLSGRFVRMDQEKFGIIPGVTDRKYYTNSFHIPVYFPISAFEKIRNMAVRMTVEAADKTVVGLATSKPVVSTIEGENKLDLTLKLDWLAPGKYIIKLTAYSVNEFGTNQMHDVVENAFAFEKIQDDSVNNKMEWNHTWWGFMMFPELEISGENKNG